MSNSSDIPNRGRLNGLNIRPDFVSVHNLSPRFLTQEQIQSWNNDGYILDLPLLDSQETEAARQEFALLQKKNTDEEWPLNLHAEQPFARDLACHPQTLRYLQDLMGSDIICFISQYINKAPGSPAGNHGHQDCVYNAMKPGCIIVWLALEDADESNGCMQFVPGSHRRGILECDETYSIKDTLTMAKWVPAPVKAGHCVIMSDMLIHSSPEHPSPTRHRPAFTATYAPARTPLLVEFTAKPVLCSGAGGHPSWKLISVP